MTNQQKIHALALMAATGLIVSVLLAQPLADQSGARLNALSINALSLNALSLNGNSLNALSVTGSTADQEIIARNGRLVIR